MSGGLSNLVEGDSTNFLISPIINIPIFEGGRLRAQIKVEEARNSIAAITYEQTILNAFEETETALVRFNKQQATRARLRNAVNASSQSVALSKSLYDNGLTNFINVLDSERELTSREDALIQAETRVLTDLVALYKALGGGWEIYEGTSRKQ